MSQVVLEFSNQNDLDLLLSFAKRLKVKVISIKKNTSKKLPQDNRANMMLQAASDPLFIADVEEVSNDFAYADQDEI